MILFVFKFLLFARILSNQCKLNIVNWISDNLKYFTTIYNWILFLLWFFIHRVLLEADTANIVQRVAIKVLTMKICLHIYNLLPLLSCFLNWFFLGFEKTFLIRFLIFFSSFLLLEWSWYPNNGTVCRSGKIFPF